MHPGIFEMRICDNELHVRTVKEEIAIAARRHEEKLRNYPDVEVVQLLEHSEE